MSDKNVYHPAHYNTGNIECIDAMIAAFGEQAVKDFCKVNAFKYLWRADHKNGEEDIKKAVWYLEKYLFLCNDDDGNDITPTMSCAVDRSAYGQTH